MATIDPFIHFNGNAEEAFTFYQSIFGGAFTTISRYKDISSPAYPIAETDANRIMYIALPIGKTDLLKAADTLTIMGQVQEKDNRYTVTITAESKEEADKLFTGLSAGGKVEMPLALGPWGNYFGMFEDKFAVQWMVDFDPKSKN